MKEMRMMLRSVVQSGDGEEEQKQSGHCRVQEANGSLILTYEEQQDTSVSTVELASDGHTAAMKRRGDFFSDFAFVPGERTQAVYRTPFGEFDTEVLTHAVSLDTQSLPMRLALDYTIFFSGGEGSRVHLEVRVR